ncbi:uncharacterized protein [Triticum aestivum]|uniref:uncharacterized protein n=1 Tax=Triticum aestivum TaxID=4565 RepID=UPI001D02F375|nr:uncharacterized protein LOC123090451 [Triticum aestivum]
MDAGARSPNKQKSDTGRIDDLSGPLSLSTRASANSLSAPIRSSGGYVGSLGVKPRVEIKGRFSVTSENVDLAKVQEIPVFKISPKPQESNSHHRKEFRDSSVSASILIPHLENLVQQTTFQQDIITNLMSNLQQNEKPNGPQTRDQTMVGDTAVETGSAERERKLLAKRKREKNSSSKKLCRRKDTQFLSIRTGIGKPSRLDEEHTLTGAKGTTNEPFNGGAFTLEVLAHARKGVSGGAASGNRRR